MPYRRRSSYSRSNRYRRRVAPRTNKVKKLVDGHTVKSLPERLIEQGAPIVSTVSAIASTVGRIMSMINVEHKYIDVNAVPSTDFATPAITPLTLCAQGDNDTQRNGNSTLGQDISIRVLSTKNPNNESRIRVVIFIDKECDGALPTLANLMETTATINSKFNKDFTKRFVVLKDKFINLTTNNPLQVTKFFVKTPYHVYYDGVSAAIGDAKENQMFILCWSTVGGANTPGVDIYSRFNFTDN